MEKLFPFVVRLHSLLLWTLILLELIKGQKPPYRLSLYSVLFLLDRSLVSCRGVSKYINLKR